MKIIRSIHNIVNKGESVVAVFTRGLNLDINNPDGTGYTGDWVMERNPEFVVIYHRTRDKNIIYKAKIVDIEGPLSEYSPERRHRIHFSNCQELGTTKGNWFEFNGGRTVPPVKYVDK